MAIGDGAFKKGEPIWVRQADGTAREGVYVVYPDSESGEAVAFDRITARD